MEQDPDEAGFLNLLIRHFKDNPFYFSYTYNLTHPFEREAPKIAAVKGRMKDQFLHHAHSWNSFYWNKYLQSPLIDFLSKKPGNAAVIRPFLLPLLSGYIGMKKVMMANKELTLVLISRRSRERCGTRYFSRGIDEDGNVSNFNETEQILICGEEGKRTFASHVQTRGSIPVFWAEMNGLAYVPKLTLTGQIQKAVCSS